MAPSQVAVGAESAQRLEALVLAEAQSSAPPPEAQESAQRGSAQPEQQAQPLAEAGLAVLEVTQPELAPELALRWAPVWAVQALAS